jgi:hypothetical protein
VLPRRLRPGFQPLVLLVFLGLAVWMFAPAWSSPTDTTLEGGDGDPAIFMWFLRWVPFALEHGHDPLLTHRLNYPDGVNLMWNTSLPLLGLLLAPVTVTLGPVLSLNLLLVLGYALSAWCAYLAIRRFAPGQLAAAVAVAVVAPLWPSGTIGAEKVATPEFFTGPAVRELPRDSAALVLPWSYRRVSTPMTWQAEAGLWFRMPGGYFIGPMPAASGPASTPSRAQPGWPSPGSTMASRRRT